MYLVASNNAYDGVSISQAAVINGWNSLAKMGLAKSEVYEYTGGLAQDSQDFADFSGAVVDDLTWGIPDIPFDSHHGIHSA